MPALFYGLYVTPLHGWAVPAGRYWGGVDGRRRSRLRKALPGAAFLGPPAGKEENFFVPIGADEDIL